MFTGAKSPTTAARFPRGEAVEYREHAIELGVPADAIVVEPRATNTGQNIAYTRELLTDPIESVLLISKPYMERRAYATCRRVWPGVDVVCASEPTDFFEYASTMGDPTLVVNMLVGARAGSGPDADDWPVAAPALSKGAGQAVARERSEQVAGGSRQVPALAGDCVPGGSPGVGGSGA